MTDILMLLSPVFYRFKEFRLRGFVDAFDGFEGAAELFLEVFEPADIHNNNMETYKKSGLDEAQSEFICPERKIFLRGISKALILKSKIEAEHLSCFLCNQIIWRAVACGQPNCFANFCEYCVGNYGQELANGEYENERKCPKCLNRFLKITIPLMNNLLSEITLKCAYFAAGCEQQISYDGYLKHVLQCDYRKIQCEGCALLFFQKSIVEHRRECSQIVVHCPKCLFKRAQLQFKTQHTEIYCLEFQLRAKEAYLQGMEKTVQQLRNRLNSYEMVMEKIIKGDTIPLHLDFYSSFPFNFQFSNAEARLCKSSWNTTKQKFDFLHFYVTSPIKIESPVGFQWRMSISVLKGNLLIGICSSLSTNSVDFVINRFGEIKKKESSENKYKLLRKGNLTFSEGDVISFNYLALRKVLRIENQTMNVEGRLEAREITELGENLYSFYSLDTINDCVKFM